MLPKRRRRVRAGSPHSALASSTPPAARFPGVAIYLAEPRMGRSRRAFLTRLARSKGFRILDVYRCAAPARARRWGGGMPASWGAGVFMPVTPVHGLNCGPGRELARSCCDSKQHLRLWVPSQPWYFAVAVWFSNPEFLFLKGCHRVRGFLKSHTRRDG